MMTSSTRLLDVLSVPLGYGLLGLGVALLVLPGPGLPLLAGGLALLARRRPWARRALRAFRRRLARAAGRFRRRRAGRRSAPRPPSGSLPAALLLAALLPAGARAEVVPWVDLETGRAWSVRNDVRIPGDSGTPFSLQRDLRPLASFRAHWAFAPPFGLLLDGGLTVRS